MTEQNATVASIRLADDETANLEGNLTFESVTALFRDMEQRLPGSGPVRTIDLSRVRQVDSAGLALLLEWQSRQKRRGVELRMTGAPDNLLSLARLCEAVDLLGISGREVSA